MGHQVEDCFSLEIMLVPPKEDRLKALEALEAARQRWLNYEIRPKEEFPQDSVQDLFATNKAAQTTISEAYVSLCKNIFCRIGEAFQKKRLQATAKETALEKEACQIMYGLDDYATAAKIVTRAANLKETYYRLQLTNRALGIWKNLDYLCKIPPSMLLVQDISLQKNVSLFREDYLIYEDTKAINTPYQRSTSFAKYRNIVKRLKHTLISYYAVDAHTVALAKTTFVGGQEEGPSLVYKNISIDAFKEQLKAMN